MSVFTRDERREGFWGDADTAPGMKPVEQPAIEPRRIEAPAIHTPDKPALERPKEPVEMVAPSGGQPGGIRHSIVSPSQSLPGREAMVVKSAVARVLRFASSDPRVRLGPEIAKHRAKLAKQQQDDLDKRAIDLALAAEAKS